MFIEAGNEIQRGKSTSFEINFQRSQNKSQAPLYRGPGAWPTFSHRYFMDVALKEVCHIELQLPR